MFATAARSPLITRLAIGGMLIAVLALGSLAVWATVQAQNLSHAIAQSGVQTSGHLRAVQALGQIDTHADLLELGLDQHIVADLRSAQRVLLESLRRMEDNSVLATERRMARESRPDVRRLFAAVENHLGVIGALGRPATHDEDVEVAAEDRLQAAVEKLQLRFNDIGFDPSRSLRANAAAAAAHERKVHSLALVLVPLGLGFVALCAWQLRTFRRRADEERERMEAELRLAQRLESVGQLAAGIAHEINTPIQFVGDSVGFLKDAYADLSELEREYRSVCTTLAEAGEDGPALLARLEAAEQRADLEYLRERIPVAFERTEDGLSRVASIVGAMKDFGRPNQVEHTAADLNAALRSALVVTQNEYKYLARVETELGDMPPVVCNVSELNQVFLNLIVNAAHAIEDAEADSGLIRVSSARENGAAIITIADNGTGIPKEIRERIFDPFFTTKEVGRGTGQGLAIARSIIVDKHGGSIAVDSAVGGGTTFAIRIPITPE
jgi:signal transduction histidine kinase